jgi:hypothetical protein
MVRHEAAEALGALGDVASRETIARSFSLLLARSLARARARSLSLPLPGYRARAFSLALHRSRSRYRACALSHCACALSRWLSLAPALLKTTRAWNTLLLSLSALLLTSKAHTALCALAGSWTIRTRSSLRVACLRSTCSNTGERIKTHLRDPLACVAGGGGWLRNTQRRRSSRNSQELRPLERMQRYVPAKDESVAVCTSER